MLALVLGLGGSYEPKEPSLDPPLYMYVCIASYRGKYVWYYELVELYNYHSYHCISLIRNL